jgi:hypothetical protein
MISGDGDASGDGDGMMSGDASGDGDGMMSGSPHVTTYLATPPSLHVTPSALKLNVAEG